MQRSTNNFDIYLSISEIVAVLERSSVLVEKRNIPTSGENLHSKRGIRVDSRKVENGDVFLAYKGVSVDGHAFIKAAKSKGAGLVITDGSQLHSDILVSDTCALRVRDGRQAWAILAAEAHRNPQRELKVIAVTGTNGKTSTAWFISHLLESLGETNLFLGTLGAQIGSHFFPTNHTTPDPPELYGFMREAVNAGSKYVVMEAASQSLAHHKLDLIRFDVAVFTSFSRDHLDLHKSMDEYFRAKWRLFDELAAKDAFLLLNHSIRSWMAADQGLSNPFWYGTNSRSDQSYSITVSGRNLDGASVSLHQPDDIVVHATIPLLGDHLVENFCAAAIVVSRMLNAPLEKVLELNVSPVPGRGEIVKSKSQTDAPTVIVDYAHTPDGLEKALRSVRQYAGSNISVVFGCGGDRDPGKRPEMGGIASQLADALYITSDNPRRENPEQIISEIASGVTNREKPCFTIPDRRRAIEAALRQAGPGDVVLIAGKGHENYQIIGESKIYFDDRQVARSVLEDIASSPKEP